MQIVINLVVLIGVALLGWGLLEAFGFKLRPAMKEGKGVLETGLSMTGALLFGGLALIVFGEIAGLATGTTGPIIGAFKALVETVITAFSSAVKCSVTIPKPAGCP